MNEAVLSSLKNFYVYGWLAIILSRVRREILQFYRLSLLTLIKFKINLTVYVKIQCKYKYKFNHNININLIIVILYIAH